MKSIKISFWLLTALFSVSCSQENGALYENPDSKGYVSLASSKYIAELVPEDGTKINVQIQRNSTAGTFDAPFRFSSSPSLFTMTDTIAHFIDGESVTNLTISFPGSEQMGIGTTYTLKVSLADSAMLSIGGIAQQTLTLKRRLTWSSIGTGQWTDGIIAPVFGAPALTYDVAIEGAEEAEGLYRMVNPYGYDVYPYTAEEEVTANPCYVMINAINPAMVVMPRTGIGIDWGYGEIFAGSLTGKYGTVSGKKITFPAGVLGIGMPDWSGSAYGAPNTICVLTLP